MANAFYAAQKGLVLLCIAVDKVHPEIKYEKGENQEFYPHIYGPLNLDSVVLVAPFEPGEDGKFVLPKEITDKT